MAGRKPKPTAVKQLEGNPGHRPLPSNEPRYDAASDRAPTGMSDDARKLWHNIAHQVIGAGVLRTVDVPAFALMAEHYAIAMQAAHDIAALRVEREADAGKPQAISPLLVIDANGLARKTPLLQVFRDNAAAYRAFAAEFGLTPSSRARIHVQGDGEQMSLADELFGMIRKAEAEQDAGH